MDRMDSTELAANQFRMTQTREKLARDGVRTGERATQTHEQVGKEVRAAIQRIGGTLPENIPPAEPIKIGREAAQDRQAQAVARRSRGDGAPWFVESGGSGRGALVRNAAGGVIHGPPTPPGLGRRPFTSSPSASRAATAGTRPAGVPLAIASGSRRRPAR